jgi:thioredoxin 1
MQREIMEMSEHVKAVSDASFETDVLESKQPALVDFWAEWCAPCRMIAPTIEAIATQYSGRAAVVKVNVDENPGIAQRYGIKGIPTLILFREGKEEERIVGATSKESLTRLVEKHTSSATAA